MASLHLSRRLETGKSKLIQSLNFLEIGFEWKKIKIKKKRKIAVAIHL